MYSPTCCLCKAGSSLITHFFFATFFCPGSKGSRGGFPPIIDGGGGGFPPIIGGGGAGFPPIIGGGGGIIVFTGILPSLSFHTTGLFL
ncbi:hypothetical protein DAE35_21160, partial [Salmonella enterica]|nr:hypothetical protein [Salmonella enterica]